MEISPTVNELVQAVGNEWFDAIGLSISIQAQLKDLSVLIAQIKKLSRNPNAVVLLGGPIFTIQNFNASDFGADAICTDAKDAVEMTLSLIKND
jgi:methanogenic corrinoid protein MtbC1